MRLNYAYTPQIWLSVLTVLLLIALAVYSWRRRSLPGVTPFMISCLFAAAWAGGNLMEVAALDQATQVDWVKFQAIWQLPLIVAIFCFVLEYAWPGRWLTRRNLALLSIPPLLVFGFVLTNDLHHWIWRGFSFGEKVIPLRAPGNWITVAYGYGLTLVNLVILAWLFRRSQQHRWPVMMMLIGQILGRGLYLLQAAQLLQSNLPLGVLAVTMENLMYALALFGFRLFDPIPLARQTAIEQLQSGMLVLDPWGKIVSLNPAAIAILGSPEKRLRGRPIQDLLPAWAQLPGELQSAGVGQAEISLAMGLETRCYQLEVSALNDWRGLAVGRLLLLHDVTEQKRAQVQIVEQQRALATLRERERLARELHDSIGQVLGYVSLQAQAIRKRAQGGDLPAVEAQLSRLAEVAQAAHADVRESILSLNAGAGQAWSFRTALRQYLDAYSDQYGIQTELSLPEELGEGVFEPETEVQLLRVIQEALNNARKHGCASCVQVTFTIQESLAHLLIADDGRGFDPDLLNENEGSHYGLQFMRERAGQIGGRLRVQSAPGEGTCVTVEVPVKANCLTTKNTKGVD